MERKESLYRNIIELMKKKAENICSDYQCEKSLIELGSLLERSHLEPAERVSAQILLQEVAQILPPEGDTRNARAYLNELIEKIRNPDPVAQGCRMGSLA